MNLQPALAIAHPNIAFIKYWGDLDPALHLPANPSLSMNLGHLYTRARVAFDPDLPTDSLTMNGEPVSGPPLQRLSAFLDRVRLLAGFNLRAVVDSHNNFPAGAGIASSASAFAALALAASTAAGLQLDERRLSRLARLGSGSACRSVPSGFVQWHAAPTDEASYAQSIASPEHWDLVDCVVIVSRSHKSVGSTEGHLLAETSPLQPARVQGVPGRLERCRRALLDRDFETLAEVVELDSNLMHAVMLTSSPALFYWLPPTLALMQQVIELRAQGLPVFYTIDAGPNLHIICPSAYLGQVVGIFSRSPGVEQVLTSSPGGPARLCPDPDCSSLLVSPAETSVRD
jgi:diphosphomevalonate decarboxylase